MSTSQYVELVLTCASWQQSQAIADVLLKKKLVACVEFIEVKSVYRWQHQLNEAKEIKLIMQSSAANFDRVEHEVSSLHSYDTFVLAQIPLSDLSVKARIWLGEETKT